LLTLARLTHCPGDRVTSTQPVLADQRQRNVYIVRPGQIARRPNERVVVKHVQDPRDGQQHVVLADLHLTTVATIGGALAAAIIAVAAVAVTEAPATATTGVVVIIA
jgi:hypothetical protein